MTLTSFASDPIVWAQKRRNQWAFLLFLLLPVFGCLLFSPLALDPNSRITAAAAVIFFLIAIWSLHRNQQTTLFDQVKEPHVRIAEDHLEYFRETTTTTIAFNDLKRLVVRQNPPD